MDNEGRIKVGGKDITEVLICPICNELPKAAIYQCKNGHVLCHECYSKLRSCPECRCRLPPPSTAIRNLRLQQLLDEVVQVDCSFKENGCGKRMNRDLAEYHVSGCSYNFQKFGKFADLCPTLGYPTCSFQVNNGNTAVAIRHLQSEHGFHLTESSKFQMELEQFKKAAYFQKTSAHLWTPVIVKLGGSQGHVVLAPMLNQKEDFACVSIWFPGSDSYRPLEPQTPVQVKFTVPHEESCKLVFLQRPMSISEAASLSLENLPKPFHVLLLTEHMRDGEKMKIICKIKGNGVSLNAEVNDSELSTFSCKIRPPLQIDLSAGATDKAKKWLDEEITRSKMDREKLWDFLGKLFEEKFTGYSPKDLAYLKHEALRLALWRGTTSQIVYLREKCDLNDAFDEEETILQYVVKNEPDKRIGLEKVKILIDSGMDFKRVNSSQQSLLHYAAFYGNEEIAKFVVEKLKLDVKAKDYKGRTPLEWAVKNRDEESGLRITQLLLDRGADFEVETEWKRKDTRRG